MRFWKQSSHFRLFYYYVHIQSGSDDFWALGVSAAQFSRFLSLSTCFSLISTTLQSDFLHTVLSARGESGGITAFKLWSFVMHVNVCGGVVLLLLCRASGTFTLHKMAVAVKYVWFMVSSLKKYCIAVFLPSCSNGKMKILQMNCHCPKGWDFITLKLML